MSDHDPPEVYVETRRRSRKVHRCCECRDRISVGDEYIEISGLWDGRWDRYRQHIKCHSWFTVLAHNRGDDGLEFSTSLHHTEDL